MNKIIYPNRSEGSIDVISSKSLSHRALICAALSKDKSIINNISLNDDILRTIECLRVLGAKITVDNKTVTVIGFDIYDELDEVVLNANESGSTLRFLIPLASIKAKRVIFKGSKTLMSRPLDVYQKLFDDNNLTFEILEDRLIIEGKLILNEYLVAGNISSQFISGIMFIMPLLKEDAKITLTSPLESKSYVDLTLAMLEEFNIKSDGLAILSKQTYLASDLTIEADYSQAAFFLVLGAINNEVTIENLNLKSKQGDREILSILENLGADITYANNAVTVKKSKLKSLTIDLKHIPDLGPILFILGLFTEESLVLLNTERLLIKESDRINSMLKQLEKFGANISHINNTVTINRLDNFKNVVMIDSCNDHRIAMAFSILATTLETPLKIVNAEAVNKSYPRFYKDLAKLNINIE